MIGTCRWNLDHIHIAYLGTVVRTKWSSETERTKVAIRAREQPLTSTTSSHLSHPRPIFNTNLATQSQSRDITKDPKGLYCSRWTILGAGGNEATARPCTGSTSLSTLQVFLHPTGGKTNPFLQIGWLSHLHSTRSGL